MSRDILENTVYAEIMGADGGILAVLAKTLDWLKSDRHMLTLAICSGIGLLVPEQFVPAPVVDYRSLLWIPFVFCTVYLLTAPMFAGVRWMQEKSLRHTIKSRLQHLAADEMAVLSKYRDTNSSTLIWAAAQEEALAAHSLATDKILFIATADHALLKGFFPYTIQPWIRQYLRKNRQIL